MKHLLFLLFIQLSFAQVNSDNLLGLPVLTTAERTGIPTASIGQGSLAYDSDESAIFQFNGTSWEELIADSSQTIVLNRVGTGTNTLLPNATDSYRDFPLNAAHVQINTGSNFTVLGDGEIRVLSDGVYLMTASLSTNNMPSGATKYIIGAFVNGGLVGYLTRGFANLPAVNWWGGSGSLMYNLSANDVITIRYVLNNGGTPLSGRYINIGITKI